MSIEKRLLKGIAAGIVSLLSTFLQTIILVPLLLNFWGNELYGIWLALNSTFLIIQTIDIGHQFYIGNEFNKLYNINRKELYGVFNSSISVAILIGLIQLAIIVVILILNLVPILIGIKGGSKYSFEANLSLIILMVSWILSGNIGGIISKIFITIGEYEKNVLWTVVLKIINFISLAIVASCGGKILLGAAAVGFSSLMTFLFIYFHVKKRAKEFFPIKIFKNIKTGFKNFKKSSLLTLNLFLNQLSTNGIILFISNIFSVIQTPLFTTLRTLTNVATQFTNILIQPLQIDIVRFKTNNEFEKLLNTFRLNWFVSGLIVNLGLILVIPFAKILYDFWTNNKLVFDQTLFIYLAMSVSLFNFGSAINYYFYSLNYLKEQIFITIFRTIPIFLVPSILHEQYGLASVGIGILIGEIFSSVILPIILFYSDIKKNHYRTNISEFLKRFIPTIFFCFVSFCIIYKPDQILNISIIGFILLVSVYYVTWFFLPLELKKRVHLVFYKNR